MKRKKDVFDVMWENPDLSLREAHALLHRPKRIAIFVVSLLGCIAGVLLYLFS